MVRLGRAVNLCAECVMDLMFVSTRTEAVLADALTVILARNAQPVSTFLVILCEMFSYFGIYQNVVQLSFTHITNISNRNCCRIFIRYQIDRIDVKQM